MWISETRPQEWPKPPDELPPSHYEMVRQSREAIARGEGELIEDLIRRVSGQENSASSS